MNNIVLIIIVFVIAVFIRFLLYFFKYLYLRKVGNKLDTTIQGRIKNASEDAIKKSNEASLWVQGNIIEIKKIVLKSGTDDRVHSYMQPVGYGHVQQMNMSVLENMIISDPKIYMESRDMVDRAKGFYKVEAFKSLNPLFWIEFIIFLPKEIIKYFSVDDNNKSVSILTKIMQVIYWIGSLIFAYLNLKNNL